MVCSWLTQQSENGSSHTLPKAVAVSMSRSWLDLPSKPNPIPNGSLEFDRLSFHEAPRSLISEEPTGLYRQGSKDSAAPPGVVSPSSTSGGTERQQTAPATSSHPPQLKAQGRQATGLMTEEKRETGAVTSKVISSYIRNGGVMLALVTVFLMILVQVVMVLSDVWLAEWTKHSGDSEPSPPLGSDYGLSTTHYYAAGYGGFVLVATLLLCVESFMYVSFGKFASETIYFKMMSRLVRAPQWFFDTTPTGRIISRISRDVNVVDQTLVFSMHEFVFKLVRVAAILALVCASTYYFAIAIMPIAVCFWHIQRYYRRTATELKRLDSISRSPILAHFSAILNGLPVIRASNLEVKMLSECFKNVDNNVKFYLTLNQANRWLGVRLDSLGACIVFLICTLVVSLRGHVDPSMAGLIVGSSFSLTLVVNRLVRDGADTEMMLNSVERTNEYSTLPIEGEPLFSRVRPAPVGWPTQGKVEFRNVSCSYREEMPEILKGVTFTVEAGQHVGVCGRSGAGKSSLINALFRLVECSQGEIEIDGVNIATLRLSLLRSNLAVIPQDPVLFHGTIRYNLDPFNHRTDEACWNSLKRVNLEATVRALGGLESQIAESGANFSLGQKQLFCFARALLRNCKLVVLDEATASVDVETDQLIQTMLREELRNCTVLTIAHRLDSIADYDKILVLDQGRVAEFDSPVNLLTNANSHFYRLLHAARSAEGQAPV